MSEQPREPEWHLENFAVIRNNHRWLSSEQIYTDPASLNVLAADTTAGLQGLDISLVVSWLSPNENVLAHAIASSLSVPRVAVDEDLGLISVFPDVAPRSTILIVGSEFDSHRSIEALHRFFSDGGHRIVGSLDFTG